MADETKSLFGDFKDKNNAWLHHDNVLKDTSKAAKQWILNSSAMVFFSVSRRSIWVLYAREFDASES